MTLAIDENHQLGKKEMEPTTTSVGAGAALFKYFGFQILIGSVATALAFIVNPPKTRWEFFARMICTLVASYLFGPALVSLVHSWYPGIFESARALAALNGQDPSFGLLYIAAPLQVLAGMPAWWVLGAFVRWFDRRRDQDIGQMIGDARSQVGGGRYREPGYQGQARRETRYSDDDFPRP